MHGYLITQAAKYGLLVFILWAGYIPITHAADPHYDGYFVDAYSMLDDDMKDPGIIIKAMDKNKIKKVVLSAIGVNVMDRLEDFSSQHSKHVIPAFKTTFNGYLKNKPQFSRFMNKRISDYRYGAIGEAWVYKKWFDNTFIEVSLTDDRITAIIDQAQSNDWPVLLHINTYAMDSNKRRDYLNQLDALLEAYPKLNFGLTQKGWLSYSQVRYLLERHSNIHFLLTRTPDTYAKTYEELLDEGKKGLRMIFHGGDLKSDWQALFEKHPSRFLISIYAIGDLDWGDHYDNQIKWWRYALGHLRPATADAIAHGNAERLWRIGN